MSRNGWYVLAWVAGVFAVLGLLGGVWDLLANEAWSRLILTPLNLLFWGWIGLGALRRAQAADAP